MTLEIEPLDPADEAAMAAAHRVVAAAEAVDVPDFPAPCPLAFRAELTHQTSSTRLERFVARDAGRTVVGVLSLELPMRDNLHSADVVLVVHPEHRRRGVGRALHAFLLGRLPELGRSSFSAEVVQALPDGPPRAAAGAGFATAMAAKPALTEVRSRLDLPSMDEPALAALVAEAQTRATGYQVVSWRDRTPEEYVAGEAYLSGRLSTDAPQGDLKWEPQQVDAQRMREREASLAAARWHRYTSGAVHVDSGRLVAVTTLARQHTTPWQAFQWITLVDPAHRGHRLGALVKVENLRYARRHEPQLRVIDTWNAEVNDHMRAINTALGFRPVDNWVFWQQEA